MVDLEKHLVEPCGFQDQPHGVCMLCSFCYWSLGCWLSKL